MSWFSARLLFESEVRDDQQVDPLCEESIRMIEANDKLEAERRAEEVGTANEHEYLNDHGVAVRWRFVRVMEIQDLCESTISHGTEVYSRVFREKPPLTGS